MNDHSCLRVNDSFIYFGAGTKMNSSWRFDLTNKKWHKLPDMPVDLPGIFIFCFCLCLHGSANRLVFTSPSLVWQVSLVTGRKMNSPTLHLCNGPFHGVIRLVRKENDVALKALEWESKSELHSPSGPFSEHNIGYIFYLVLWTGLQYINKVRSLPATNSEGNSYIFVIDNQGKQTLAFSLDTNSWELRPEMKDYPKSIGYLTYGNSFLRFARVAPLQWRTELFNPDTFMYNDLGVDFKGANFSFNAVLTPEGFLERKKSE